MVKEKGATPSRRLPSRGGRESSEADPTDDGALNGDVAPALAAAGRGTEKPKQPQQPSSEDNDNNVVQDTPAKEEAAPKPVTPRGRGRPRKKPLEQPPTVKAKEANMAVAAATAGAAAGAASPRADGSSSSATSPRANSSSPRAVGGWQTARRTVATKKEEEEEGVEVADGGGNESDEWSDHDEVHDLPDEIKAQFGQVRQG